MESKRIELKDRTEWKNEKGDLNRLDGPAVELNDGSKTWYINGIEYTEEEFHQELIKIKLNRLINEERI